MSAARKITFSDELAAHIEQARGLLSFQEYVTLACAEYVSLRARVERLEQGGKPEKPTIQDDKLGW